jgi:hypothetical protein
VLRDVPVVAVGEVVSMREGAGIKVRSSPLMYSTDRSQVMTIRMRSVLKGKDLVTPGSIIEALVFPEDGGDVRPEEIREPPPLTFDEAYGEYKGTGMWPWYWRYPKLRPNELQIFFLDKVRERDPKVDESSGVTEVTGITRYHLGKNVYVYAWSLEAKPLLLSTVSRYVEINNIKVPERRGEELLAFSLSLIEDSQMSERLTTGVTLDFGTLLSWEKPGFKWLTESRVEKLIVLAVDRSRPQGVRSWTKEILRTAYKYADCKIKVEPFLQAIADSRDSVDVRDSFISFLEELNTNTAEVREGFKKILQREPVNEYEARLWERLRQSKILKDEP